MITLPHNTALRFVGSGMGGPGSAESKITRIRRTATNAAAMFSGAGLGSAQDERLTVEFSHMWLDGGSVNGLTSGPLLSLTRASQLSLDHMTLRNCTGGGLLAPTLFNSRIAWTHFRNSGDATHAACTLTSSALGTFRATNTVHLSDCEFEGNDDTMADLYLTGAGALSSDKVMGTNLKFEGGGNAPGPYMLLENIHLSSFSNVEIANSRARSSIEMTGGDANPVRFTNLSVWENPAGTDPDYQIEQSGGSLMIANSLLAGDLNTAHVHLDSTVASDGFWAQGVKVLTGASADDTTNFIDDDRGGGGTPVINKSYIQSYA